ncbi:MAG: class I SAM-dependent methyltransferase [Candidatus Levybacteria bacterium]|nr:class I SAM-dependent methyltransferase [Candidatus Levybacteria bacterium]
MQHVSVKKLFKEQVRRYSHEDQYENSPLAGLILKWLKREKTKEKAEICEFGGGAGQLLGEIQKSYPNYNYTNVEIIDDYKRFLVSREIKYINASILDSKLADSSFDIIIMRDVLHHLVGKSYKETVENQRYALYELKRLVKPGGAIFLEELTNESGIATRIIYYLCLLNTRIGMHIPRLFISKNVIVAFLTSSKLLNMCSQVFGEKNIEKQELVIKVKWYFRSLHFFGGLKKIILSIRK